MDRHLSLPVPRWQPGNRAGWIRYTSASCQRPVTYRCSRVGTVGGGGCPGICWAFGPQGGCALAQSVIMNHIEKKCERIIMHQEPSWVLKTIKALSRFASDQTSSFFHQVLAPRSWSEWLPLVPKVKIIKLTHNPTSLVFRFKSLQGPAPIRFQE